jgi:hypothetical protein
MLVSLSTQKKPYLSNYHLVSEDNKEIISDGILALGKTSKDFGLTSSMRFPVLFPGNGSEKSLE